MRLWTSSLLCVCVLLLHGWGAVEAQEKALLKAFACPMSLDLVTCTIRHTIIKRTPLLATRLMRNQDLGVSGLHKRGVC